MKTVIECVHWLAPWLRILKPVVCDALQYPQLVSDWLVTGWSLYLSRLCMVQLCHSNH